MSNTLIIDTSFGSTVGIVGHEPIVETDSRTHVERLQVNIAKVVEDAGLKSSDIKRVVVGVGPAPFTGLRAGLVAAKAIAFANNAEILGCDSLLPQSLMMRSGAFEEARKNGVICKDLLLNIPNSVDSCDSNIRHYVLSLNDARRRQVYMSLYDNEGNALIDMDIDYPQNVVARVNEYLASENGENYCVDVLGHGAKKYVEDWQNIAHVGVIAEVSALDLGVQGLQIFEQCAEDCVDKDERVKAVEPLYLRRPDVSVPNPLKHVLGSGEVNKAKEK
ncbi:MULTISPECIES: tRNA (adenosine(37)-N6)-threonylcarbamoyltransferase complex dimerization subunit type 1 TsaB [Gardnerella]|uniref:tRNA (adenosine(37)-N6)-threonylcarbamoyltransferase complex dimerization subunit type 1 TsaB n=1 Tax=Gardnerella TaxID=2701 RepID=UPI0015749743|nr:tRNA (adenosine(37)-N6)-threonylcarbamoyltransferase complex dimerization subunit type 1 TsaB [Gardnerella vaginalis]NSX44340.1 tRNA (adenosine(37)-N6)-threonylcarbamoyltransferase complex dimerization subunit type 1 TsaB [Gardnerella vaginalis]